MRAPSRIREWLLRVGSESVAVAPWRNARAGRAVMSPRLARSALPRVRGRPRPCRSFFQPSGFRACRPTSSVPRRTRVENQRALVLIDRLRIGVTRTPLIICGASPKNVIQRLGMIGWSGRLQADQLEVERVCDPTGDLVLQGEEV